MLTCILDASLAALVALPRGPLLAAVLVVVAGSVVIIALGRQSEPYTFDHVELNRLGGQTGRPSSEWMNMGYWKNTSNFPEACEALARKVLDAASLQPGGHHLDVAHGSGDSVLLVLDRASASPFPPQASVTGITSLASHSLRTQERVTSVASPEDDMRVRMICGDAIYRPSESTDHPFAPGARGRYTSVICLDAAYHFDTRLTFLAQALDSLAPGGSLALGDILSSVDYPTSQPDSWSLTPCAKEPAAPTATARRVLSRIVLPLLAVPPVNIVPLATLAQQMLELGFVDVALSDVSDDVWRGFGQFLRTRGGLWRAAGWGADWLGAQGGLRWVVIKGKKPADM